MGLESQSQRMSRKKLPSVRQIGQLCLPSSFFQKPPNTSSSESDNQPTKPPPKKTPISLSDFLNRKLDKGVTKDKPVSSAAGIHHIGKKRRTEIEAVVDENVFQQFKHPRIETDNQCDGLEGSEEVDARNRNPFRLSSSGADKRSATSRHLLVIGDDPKPKSRRRVDAFVSHQTPKPLYNHYANGSGWWGCDREGIDNEEVGCSDAWEGMGATTNLGGLDWH